MARGKTAPAPTRTKAKSSAKASTNKASTAGTAKTTDTAKTAVAPTRRAVSTGGPTYRELYAEAQRRDIKGRSSMDKAQLERVLGGKHGK